MHGLFIRAGLERVQPGADLINGEILRGLGGLEGGYFFLQFLHLLVSRLRGLSITVDSTHLNRHMAKKFAKEVEIKFL